MSTKETPTERVFRRLYTVIKEEDVKKDIDIPALIVGLTVTMAQLVRQGYATDEEVTNALRIALKNVVPNEDEDEDDE